MKTILAWVLLASAATAAWAQPLAPMTPPKITAAEIVAKNAAARGGVAAWSKTDTMVWAGHTESSSAPDRKMPFMLELKRPDRTRFELATGAGKSLRIYNGSSGWKLHTDSSGMPEVQTYSAEELAFARDAQVIDGPLMHYTAQHGAITLTGIDTVEGRKAYVLNARLPSGDGGRVWVDAGTFLEIRLDRESRTASGRTTTGSVFYRDYRTFKGLKLPVIIETGTGPGNASNKLVIEKVSINPAIDDKTFEKPLVASQRHGGVVIDARGVAAPPPP